MKNSINCAPCIFHIWNGIKKISNQLFVTIYSSDGIIMVDNSGNVLAVDCDIYSYLSLIQRIDLNAYRNTYGPSKLSIGLDILDVGYWNKNGVYNPPNYDWQSERDAMIA